jgi:hypothetical protein
MILDDKPLLTQLAKERSLIATMEQAAEQACALIARELEPFEKYIGPVTVTVGPTKAETFVTAAWRYRLPNGAWMAIIAKLELDDYGWTIRSKHFRSLSQSIRPLTSDSLAAAFLKVNGTVAEQAFEAIVREKPGQICSLLS